MDFTPLQSYFDHVYVITVENAIDRQAKMTENLEGLKFTFFVGAYKKDFTIDELIEAGVYDEQKAKRMHRFDKPMNTTQIGCAWSHRLVYEDMLENNFERVLILEDDTVPNKEGLAHVQEMIKALPEDWELWYLDYHKNLRRNFATWLMQLWHHTTHACGRLKWSHRMISNMCARKFKPHLFIAGNHQFASAYGITRSAAEKLVRLQTPLAFQSDHLLAYVSTNQLLKAYVSYPKVFLNEGQLQDKRTREKYVDE
jgi:glycosyl transferase family 25